MFDLIPEQFPIRDTSKKLIFRQKLIFQTCCVSKREVELATHISLDSIVQRQ